MTLEHNRANAGRQKTGKDSSFVVIAPGRVNLIGEHTDYNEGLVLPMAIEPHIRMEVIPRGDDWLHLRTGKGGESEERLDMSRCLEPSEFRGSWSAYPCGVVAGFQRLGWKIPGCEVHITATLPAGGGLSSSAALEVGMATVVETLCGRQLPPGEKALLCQQAEHEFAGVPCGIMDPFAVTFAKAGHAMLLDCRTQEIEYVPLDVRQVLVLVIHSGVKHDLAEGEYAKRRHECEAAARLLGVASLRDIDRLRWQEAERLLPEPLQRRARHVVTEHDRTLGFVRALKAGGWEAAGEHMFGSHVSLSRDYEVSCPELDLLVEMARGTEGVFGCRMTGGGFGGCVVALVDAEFCQSVQQALRTGYRQATGRDPWMIVTHAVQGAARV